jgi:hypothetical protein
MPWVLRASGNHHGDLVVLPGDCLPDTPPGEVSSKACLYGANTAEFWVLRRAANGYALVMSEIARDLEMSRRKANGPRNIRLDAFSHGYAYTNDYRFNGKSYQLAKQSSEMIGAEVPRDRSRYRNRNSFVQLPGQTSEQIQARARAWIWRSARRKQ